MQLITFKALVVNFFILKLYKMRFVNIYWLLVFNTIMLSCVVNVSFQHKKRFLY